MKLIDRQEAIDTFLEEVPAYGLMDAEGNIESGCKDKDVIAMLNNLKPVNAISIDWIEKWLERYSYRNYRREIIEFMVTEWKHEQEKQNG